MNSRTREGFYVLWTAAILICLAMSLFVLVYTSVKGGGQRADSADSGARTDQADDVDADADNDMAADPSVAVDTTILPETADGGSAYQDSLIFLGDSTTYDLVSNGLLPAYQVWIPENHTFSLLNVDIEHIQYYAPGTTDSPQSLTIAECAAAAQPEYLVITMGLNGMSYMDESSFKQYYTDLVTTIQQASPNTRIMCQSIFPTMDSKVASGYENAYVRNANDWVLGVVRQTGVRYLDTYDALLDDTGNLRGDYGADDGIHLLPAGCTAVLEYIRTHMYQ